MTGAGWNMICKQRGIGPQRTETAGGVAMNMTLIRTAVIAIFTLVMAGCTAIGKSDFSCSGPNAGIGCLPSTEVYEITNDPELHRAVVEALNAARIASEESGKPFDARAVIAGVRAGYHREPEELQKPLVDPIRSPMPVLQPAQVIRIWIGPWVDTKGDLRMPGYVFSEITPRRWSFGEPEVSGSEILAPIQVDRSTRTP